MEKEKPKMKQVDNKKEIKKLEKEKIKLEKKLAQADNINISTYKSPSNINDIKVKGGARNKKTRLEIIEDIKEEIQEKINDINYKIEMLKQEEFKALDDFLTEVWGF